MAGSVESEHTSPAETAILYLEKRAPRITTVTADFFERQRQRYAERNQEVDPVAHQWAYRFVLEYFSSRAERAEELTTPGMEEARELVTVFRGEGIHHYFATCLDGRNIPAVMVSKVPGVGRAVRTQAGEFFDFQDSFRTGGVAYDPESADVTLVTELLTSKPGETIHYSFDSHFHCKARADIHASSDGVQEDHGLFQDITRKRTIARGFKRIEADLQNQGREVATIIPDFFTYNPDRGTVWMGLEMHIDNAQIKKTGFTNEVLQDLKDRHLMIDTLDFLDDPDIASLLANEVAPVNMRAGLDKSLNSNWHAITRLYDEGNGILFTRLRDALTTVYQTGEWTIGEIDDINSHAISEETITHKAKVLLQNVVTRWSIAQNKNQWPFDTHQEQGVVITEAGYGPFPAIDVFEIHPEDPNCGIHLQNHTHLAASLVRQLRVDNKTADPFGHLPPEAFKRGPIVIINKAVERDIQEESWSALTSIDLSSFAAIDWDDPAVSKWKEPDIQRLLRVCLKQTAHPVRPDARDLLLFGNALFELFTRTRALIFDHRLRGGFINGNLVLINDMVDKNRMPRLVVPMVI